MSNLAETYSMQERLTEAAELGLIALQGRKRLLGVDHADTPRTRDMLTMMYERSEQLAAAMDLRSGRY